MRSGRRSSESHRRAARAQRGWGIQIFWNASARVPSPGWPGGGVKDGGGQSGAELHAGVLGDEALAVAQAAEAVDGGEVGEGGGFENVGGEAAAADFAVVVLDLDLNLAEGLLSLGDGAD